MATCFGVLEGHAPDPAVVAPEADHLGPVEGDGAVRHRRPHQFHDVAGVIDLGVVIEDGPAQRPRVEPRRRSESTALAQVPVEGKTAAVARREAQDVVKRHPGTDVRALEERAPQRVQDRHRPDEMGRQVLEEQRPLPQGLAHQTEVQHLEVPEAPMDQFAGPARRARRPVLRLHEAHGQTAAGRVQGCCRHR